jgi:hypothetical protein
MGNAPLLLDTAEEREAETFAQGYPNAVWELAPGS